MLVLKLIVYHQENWLNLVVKCWVGLKMKVRDTLALVICSRGLLKCTGCKTPSFRHVKLMLGGTDWRVWGVIHASAYPQFVRLSFTWCLFLAAVLCFCHCVLFLWAGHLSPSLLSRSYADGPCFTLLIQWITHCLISFARVWVFVAHGSWKHCS